MWLTTNILRNEAVTKQLMPFFFRYTTLLTRWVTVIEIVYLRGLRAYFNLSLEWNIFTWRCGEVPNNFSILLNTINTYISNEKKTSSSILCDVLCQTEMSKRPCREDVGIWGSKDFRFVPSDDERISFNFLKERKNLWTQNLLLHNFVHLILKRTRLMRVATPHLLDNL